MLQMAQSEKIPQEALVPPQTHTTPRQVPLKSVQSVHVTITGIPQWVLLFAAQAALARRGHSSKRRKLKKSSLTEEDLSRDGSSIMHGAVL